jgi:hypothetical protein
MKPTASYVLCISNRGYRFSLVVRRVYRQLPDNDAGKHAMVRVIDESSEDYLFPSELFVPLDLPPRVPRNLFR